MTLSISCGDSPEHLRGRANKFEPLGPQPHKDNKSSAEMSRNFTSGISNDFITYT